MAKQVVGVGVSANDNTGDYLRPAMIKINENFSELYDFNDSLSTVAFSGNYDDLNNLPTLPDFDGSYNSLNDLPTLGTASAEDVAFFAISERGLPAGGTIGQILSKVDGADYNVEWVDNEGGGGGITELSEDTSPVLGGDLDLSTFDILGHVIGVDIQAYSAVLDGTTASFTTADETKLDALPDNATLTAALALKAPLASPTFTGTPAAPTASQGTDTTQIASTAFVNAAVAGLQTGAPSSLNTFAELATAIDEDVDFAGTMAAALALKAPLASPTFTGTVVVPNQTAGDNSTKAANTAYVDAAIALVEDGPGVQEELDAIILAGGAELVDLEATIGTLLSGGAGDVDQSTAAELWGEENVFSIFTPDSLSLANTLITLTPVSGNLTIDGSLFWYGIATLTEDTDINVISNITGKPRYFYAVASGATRVLTCSIADGDGNVGTAGIPIPDGVTAAFRVWKPGTDNIITFLGYSDRGWEPTASTFLAYDANRLPVLLTATETATTLTPSLVGKYAFWIPYASMIPRETNGCADVTTESTTHKVTRIAGAFDAVSNEYAQFDFWLPKGYNDGTVSFVPVWEHPSTTTNFDVTWGLQGRAYNNAVSIDQAFGTVQYSKDTGANADTIYIGPESAAITLSGTPTGERLAHFQVYRDVGGGGTAGDDDLAVDARLRGIVLFVTMDALTDD